MLPKNVALALILATNLYIPVAFPFDIASAAHTEFLLRTLSKSCTDQVFSDKFVKQSQDQVAFSLQGGDGQFSAELVEAVIKETETIYPIKLDEGACDGVPARLQNIFEIREKSLAEGKLAVEELKNMVTNNPGIDK